MSVAPFPGGNGPPGPLATKAPSRFDLVSVIMPVYNVAETLAEQLEALAGQTYPHPWELVLSDNGSTDATVAIARAWEDRLPALRVVDSSERRGVSHARNAGAAAAHGQLLAFCDGDDIVAPRWLASMVATAEENELVCGRLETETLNDETVTRSRPSLPHDELPDSLHYLPYAYGGNCAVHTEVFREMGGFDEGYLGGCEDVAFSWHVQLAGYSIAFAPDGVIHYRYRGGDRSLCRQFYRFGYTEAQLYREFRSHGVERSPARAAVKTWIWAWLGIPRALANPRRRTDWLRKVSYSWGRTRSSLRHRVLYL